MRSTQGHPFASDRDGFEAVVRDPCHVRHFLDDEVPREDIEHMVGLATCAASACNSQTWRFIAIQDRGLIAAMQAAVLERFEELALRPGLALQEQKRMVARAQALLFAKAPLCVAVLALPSSSPVEELMKLSRHEPGRDTIVCACGRSCRAPGRRCNCSPPRPMPWVMPPAGHARRSSLGSGWSNSWRSHRPRGSWRSCRSAARRKCRRPTSGGRSSRC